MPIKKIKLDELGRINVKEFKNRTKRPIVLIVDNVRSAYNIGSLFRTADAFLIERIILTGQTPHPKNNTSIEKTALSATLSVEWEYIKEIQQVILDLKKNEYEIFALEQTNSSQLLQDISVPENKKIALICGNEIEGVREDILHLADRIIEIPQEGTKHSLNVGVAVAIVLWHLIYA